MSTHSRQGRVKTRDATASKTIEVETTLKSQCSNDVWGGPIPWGRCSRPAGDQSPSCLPRSCRDLRHSSLLLLARCLHSQSHLSSPQTWDSQMLRLYWQRLLPNTYQSIIGHRLGLVGRFYLFFNSSPTFDLVISGIWLELTRCDLMQVFPSIWAKLEAMMALSACEKAASMV